MITSEGRALRAAARGRDDVPCCVLRRAGRALPVGGAGDRLHRCRPDATLVGVDSADSIVETIKGHRALSWIVAVLFGVVIVVASPSWRCTPQPRGTRQRHRHRVAVVHRYVFAFESRRRSRRCWARWSWPTASGSSPTQREYVTERMQAYADSGHPGQRVLPGTLAQHNSMTPMLARCRTARTSWPSRRLDGRGRHSLRRGRGRGERGRRGGRARRRGPGRAQRGGEPESTTTAFVTLSALLFTIGGLGVLIPPQRDRGVHAASSSRRTRRTSHSLSLSGNLDGQVVAFFVMVVAAAEVVVGLAILVTIFRTRRSASVDDASLLKF